MGRLGHNKEMSSTIALFWATFLSLSLSAFADSSVAPNIPSNLFEGDVTPDFMQQLHLKGRIPKSLIQMGSDNYYPEFVFLVDKKVRSLGIWQFKNETWNRVSYHPTDIGKKTGDKHTLGDHRTPEGIYFFIDRYEGENLDFSKYGSRAFATDYPSFFDKREGKTGSGIWLHAVPDSTPLTRGSRGCVVVRDEIIKKVTDYIALKQTPIIIEDEESYITLEEWQAKRQHLKTWLKNWRLAWQNKDLDSYMNHYSQDQFYSLKKNWHQWKVYKDILNKKYSFFEVSLSEPLILNHGDETVIKFLQNYRSNTFADFGEKTLYLKNENGQMKIVSEQWRPLPDKYNSIKMTDGERHSTQVGSVENNNL